MTNIGCDVVQDLLPLYADDGCSVGTRKLVNEHLENCPKCRNILRQMQDPIPEPISNPIEKEEGAVMKRGMKKIRRKWVASLLLVLLSIPFLVMCFNQIRGIGVCFGNLHEISIANAYLNRLAEGNYEDSYGYMALKDLHDNWLETWFDEETMVNMESDGLPYYLECVKELENIGGIDEFKFQSSFRQEDSYYLTYYAVVGGKKTEIRLSVSDNGVQSISGSLLDKTSDSALSAIDWWHHYLWCKYEGCYFDTETGEYVYYEE